jgi:hypothetical protein
VNHTALSIVIGIGLPELLEALLPETAEREHLRRVIGTNQNGLRVVGHEVAIGSVRANVREKLIHGDGGSGKEVAAELEHLGAHPQGGVLPAGLHLDMVLQGEMTEAIVHGHQPAEVPLHATTGRLRRLRQERSNVED